MSDSKIVRICGTLCLVFASIAMFESIISSTFGASFLQFDPTDESSMIGFQHFFNFLFSLFIYAISILTMYLALAGFYFSGAMGKDYWAKILFGILATFAIVELGLGVINSFLWFLHSLKTINLFDGALRDFYQFGFNAIKLRIYLLTPLISIAFGIKALAARKVNLSFQLVPIFAASLYIFVAYPTFFRYMAEIAPNFLAILIFSGLFALYFKGAVGENIWAKILLGILLLIMLINIVVELINRIFQFFLYTVSIENILIREVIEVLLAVSSGTAYLLIPLAIVFGITVLITKKANVFVGLMPIFAGVYYLLHSIFLYFWVLEIPWGQVGDSFRIGGLFGTKYLIWCLIAVAILGLSKLVRPFLISVIGLSYFNVIILTFAGPKNLETWISILLYLVVTSIFVQIIFMYYIWSAIDDGKTKIKPWLAIAVGLIPIINSIWFLVLFYKYPEAFNSFVDRNQNGGSYISSTFFTVYIVLTIIICIGFWIPYLSAVLGLLYLIVYIYLIASTCKKVTDLSLPETVDNSSASVIGI